MASFSVQAEDQSTLVNKTVNYILAGAAKQTVIKTSEITKLCLRGEKILLERILPQAINELENVSVFLQFFTIFSFKISF